MDDTVRIDLGGGHWWDVRRDITYGTVKRIQRDTLALLPDSGQPTVAHQAAINQAANDARLLGCTTAWSFGQPVTAEAIDALPDRYVETVIAVMARLYSGRSAEAEKALKKNSPWQSFRRHLSPWNWLGLGRSTN